MNLSWKSKRGARLDVRSPRSENELRMRRKIDRAFRRSRTGSNENSGGEILFHEGAEIKSKA